MWNLGNKRKWCWNIQKYWVTFFNLMVYLGAADYVGIYTNGAKQWWVKLQVSFHTWKQCHPSVLLVIVILTRLCNLQKARVTSNCPWQSCNLNFLILWILLILTLGCIYLHSTLYDIIGGMRKTLWLHSQVLSLPQEALICRSWVGNSSRHLFMEHCFYLKEWLGRQAMRIHSSGFGRHFL